uniref:DUF834 domain-containing protein n=1 Tax=Oryza nivara TaxID=4536 RepID=A0A0E0GP76_ORYNI
MVGCCVQDTGVGTAGCGCERAIAAGGGRYGGDGDEGGSAAEGCRVVAECGARRLRSSTAANNDAGRLTGGAGGKQNPA